MGNMEFRGSNDSMYNMLQLHNNKCSLFFIVYISISSPSCVNHHIDTILIYEHPSPSTLTPKHPQTPPPHSHQSNQSRDWKILPIISSAPFQLERHSHLGTHFRRELGGVFMVLES